MPNVVSLGHISGKSSMHFKVFFRNYIVTIDIIRCSNKE